jgi:hypothetical protein
MPKSSIGLADRFLGDESKQQSESLNEQSDELVCFSKRDLIPMTLGDRNFVAKELVEELLPDEGEDFENLEDLEELDTDETDDFDEDFEGSEDTDSEEPGELEWEESEEEELEMSDSENDEEEGMGEAFSGRRSSEDFEEEED